MQTREQHAGKMEKRLERWGAKFDGFTAKAREAGAEAKADYEVHLADLKSKQQAVGSKFQQLKAAGDDEWESLKTGVESAWKELEASFKKLTS
ncbi:MAG TPA: hypothetical protein VM285_14475 [Polyangia bacterium]|nr:hypothetical protein [Polyangia bacterium]